MDVAGVGLSDLSFLVLTAYRFGLKVRIATLVEQGAEGILFFGGEYVWWLRGRFNAFDRAEGMLGGQSIINVQVSASVTVVGAGCLQLL